MSPLSITRGLVILAIMTVWASSAEAYRLHTCRGVARRIAGDSIMMNLHAGQAPRGSDLGRVFERGMTAWNNDDASHAVFKWRRRQFNRIDSGNDRSEVAMVRGHYIDGVLGVTRIKMEPCLPGGWGRADGSIIAADVLINADAELHRGPRRCYEMGRPRASLLATLIHEFGHALGLGHEDHRMSIMMSTGGEGLYCGSPQMTTHPDDLAGKRALYGNGEPMVDIAASAMRVIGRDLIGLTTPRVVMPACPNALATFDWSIGNRGTAPARVDVFWYASPEPTFTDERTVLLRVERDIRIPAQRFETRSTTMPLNRRMHRGMHRGEGEANYIGFELRSTSHSEANTGNNLGILSTQVMMRGDCP